MTAEDWFTRGEGWLGRAGIGLLLVGLVLLFRYAVDRGWLTPELRIAGGLLLGGGLLLAGLRCFPGRLRYRQILMGGGTIILFITGLAASELYRFVPGSLTLLFHAAVAIGAFAIAARQRDTVMASIATLGSLLPPAFLLHDAVAGPALWLYLLLMIGWSALIAARQRPGWYDLVALPAAVLAVAAPAFPAAPGQAPLRPEQWSPATYAAATAAAIVMWLGFAVLPLLRARLRWAVALRPVDASTGALRLYQPLIVTISLALLVNSLFGGPYAFDAVFAGTAFAYAALAAFLFRYRAPAPAEVNGIGNVIFATDDFAAALAAAAAGAALLAVAALVPAAGFVGVAAVGTAAYLAAPRLRAPVLAVLANLLYALAAIEFLNRIDRMATAPAFDPNALGGIAILALAAIVLWQGRTAAERVAYGGGIFAFGHILLAEELTAVPGAPWLASVSYAVVGSALILWGLSRQRVRVQQAGLLSLALLIVRLFAYDLARVDVAVRIVLFLACGFAFLALSYRFRGQKPAGP
ncbi:MAG: DUF2339 domain-containing protein [Gemmatimonadetes bacterium]|nr:DUF2339 domain-containing protein [Gemmatimonadota bacterium]